MHLRIVLAGILLTGCATPLERVISVAGDVPDWFDERRDEVRGEGYPTLTSVPNPIDNPLTAEQTETTSRILDENIDFLNHPRAEVSTVSPADILDLRESLLAQIPADSDFRQIDLVSDEEIEAIRSVFDRFEAGALDRDQ